MPGTVTFERQKKNKTKQKENKVWPHSHINNIAKKQICVCVFLMADRKKLTNITNILYICVLFVFKYE